MSAQILIVDDSAYMRNSIRACIEEIQTGESVEAETVSSPLKR